VLANPSGQAINAGGPIFGHRRSAAHSLHR
jgi:hypothetical protein